MTYQSACHSVPFEGTPGASNDPKLGSQFATGIMVDVLNFDSPHYFVFDLILNI